ncbi:hypothetical protein DFJ74DRAFT_642080 [Hyaloraphidium curvatum]|nr:hypothetical protein DFJ74DRAFT_642080 [Hyaloraphidium curvatum]
MDATVQHAATALISGESVVTGARKSSTRRANLIAGSERTAEMSSSRGRGALDSSGAGVSSAPGTKHRGRGREGKTASSSASVRPNIAVGPPRRRPVRRISRGGRSSSCAAAARLASYRPPKCTGGDSWFRAIRSRNAAEPAPNPRPIAPKPTDDRNGYVEVKHTLRGRSIPSLSFAVSERAPDGSDRVPELMRLLSTDPAGGGARRRFIEELAGAEENSAEVCRAVLAQCFSAGLAPSDYRIEAVEGAFAVVLWRAEDGRPGADPGFEMPGELSRLRYARVAAGKLVGPVLSERVRTGRPVLDPQLPPCNEGREYAFVQTATFALEASAVRPTLRARIAPEASPPRHTAFRSPCIVCGTRTADFRSLCFGTLGSGGRLYDSFWIVSAPACESLHCAPRTPKLLTKANEALAGRPMDLFWMSCYACKAS